MNYYTLLDQNNLPEAFYNDDIYPENADGSRNSAIPSAAISITEAQWTKALGGGVQWSTSANDWVSYVAPVVITASMVDAERDRRMYGGFMYQSVAYQTDATSISNILGASQLGFMAIVAGAKQGDLRWANANQDFYWISADNSHVTMDAYTVVDFSKSAAAFRSAITYAGRALKDALAAGTMIDLYNDASWNGYSVPTPPTTS